MNTLKNLLHQATSQCWVQLASDPLANIIEDSSVIRLQSQHPGPFFNAVLEIKNPLSEEEARRIKDSYGDASLMWYSQEEDTLSQEALKSIGLSCVGDAVGMGAAVEDLERSNESPNPIHPVTSLEDVIQWMQPITEAFGLDESSKDFFQKIIESSLKNPACKHYYLTHEGKPASSITALILGESLYFCNGATHSDYRKRGLHTYLVQHALKQSLKARYALAHCFPPSRNLFQRLGLKKVCTYPIYSG